HRLPGHPYLQGDLRRRFRMDQSAANHLPASYPPRLGALLAARVDLFHAHVRHRSGNSPHTRLLSVAPRFSLLLSFLLFLVQRGITLGANALCPMLSNDTLAFGGTISALHTR